MYNESFIFFDTNRAFEIRAFEGVFVMDAIWVKVLIEEPSYLGKIVLVPI